MRRTLLLRIDFTRAGGTLGLPAVARGLVEVRTVRVSDSLSGDIAAVKPDVLCFDYDCPDVQGLNHLRVIKRELPSIPILMLTEHNSEELAVWALRSRVWDYFVKPLDEEAFLQAVQQLHELRGTKGKRAPREIVIPASSDKGRKSHGNKAIPAMKVADRAVAKAKAYVNSNFAEKISAQTVAKLCNMSAFHFSRTFKRINGVTFSDYLLEIRIRRSIELLGHHRTTVTSACYEVGFRDVSYFSRIFKRYTGITPSQYRNTLSVSAPQKDDRKRNPAPLCREASNDEVTDDLYAELLLSRLRR